MVFGSDSSALKFLTKKIHVSSALPRKVKIWGSRAHNLLACFLPSFLPSARCLIRRSSSTCALLCFVPIPFWREHKGSLSANLANRFYFAPQFCFSPAKFFAFLSHWLHQPPASVRVGSAHLCSFCGGRCFEWFELVLGFPCGVRVLNPLFCLPFPLEFSHEFSSLAWWHESNKEVCEKWILVLFKKSKKRGKSFGLDPRLVLRTWNAGQLRIWPNYCWHCWKEEGVEL